MAFRLKTLVRVVFCRVVSFSFHTQTLVDNGWCVRVIRKNARKMGF